MKAYKFKYSLLIILISFLFLNDGHSQTLEKTKEYLQRKLNLLDLELYTSTKRGTVSIMSKQKGFMLGEGDKLEASWSFLATDVVANLNGNLLEISCKTFGDCIEYTQYDIYGNISPRKSSTSSVTLNRSQTKNFEVQNALVDYYPIMNGLNHLFNLIEEEVMIYRHNNQSNDPFLKKVIRN